MSEEKVDIIAEVKENIANEVKEMKLEDFAERYLKSQHELMEVLVHVFMKFNKLASI
ncbi:MAG: hypothetical protein V4708_17485 [Bacteroidota bacterium]